ncbi:conserved hypothetical protein [Salmonella enterica subsp. enterica serovar Typhimurium str. 14028S]|uniref:Uncharacterized protein n=1 Tax=Salmonella typhimurium (strain 14028s / SGSC 2262) TaxID=588858 RepID=A0A0F6B8H3_SALT1|nr:conserved hypothetical protein [Salmonella enterica subsp. enterica serovar Typhimurium str. 14028S]
MPDGGCALSGLQYLQYQYIAINSCRPDKRSAIGHYLLRQNSPRGLSE